MSRRLNFLHLTTFYPPYSFGGDAMYIYRLAHALGDQGHYVDIIHNIDAYRLQHPADPEINFAEHPNVTRHGLERDTPWLGPLLTQQTGKPIRYRKTIHQVVSDKHFDVIHFHNISLLGPEILALQPNNSKFLKLYTAHEHWLVCPMHVLWKFGRRVCEKPDCLLCTIYGKRPPQIWRYTGMLEHYARQIDRFLAPSRFCADMHSRRGFSRTIDVLPYFIARSDMDWQSPDPPVLADPYFLFVGRLEKIKGIEIIIEAWQEISNYHLLIAGSGSQKASLEKLSGGNPRITFLGLQTQRQLGNLYFHAIATLVPSVTYETFGIIILESFARKTPVIVHDLGALPEVVRESGGGIIFRDRSELHLAINSLGTSQDLRNQLGDNGYRSFLQNWTQEVHIARYMELIRSIAMHKFREIPWE